MILVNILVVDPDEADELLAAWTADAAFMKGRPGFISTQLHRGIAGSGTFVNVAVWESVDAFRDAFSSPEFQEKLAHYPPSTTATPHLVRKEAVTGICVG